MNSTIQADYIGLNDAITMIAFDAARSPSDEIAHMVALRQPVESLFDRCRDEASTYKKYQPFREVPLSRTDQGFGLLIERLEKLDRGSWTKSTPKLIEAASSVTRAVEVYEETYSDGFNVLLAEGRGGGIRMFGRLSSKKADRWRMLEPADFHGEITVDCTRQHLTPVRYGSKGDIPLFAVADPRLCGQTTMYDLRIDRNDLHRIVIARGNGGASRNVSQDSVQVRSRKAAISQSELSRWFVDIFSKEFEGKVVGPKPEQIMIAANRAFPQFNCNRDDARWVKAKHRRPEWNDGGRYTNDAKKKLGR